MGQRPARRECRPRHDADAGCRNPEDAEGILNRPSYNINILLLGGGSAYITMVMISAHSGRVTMLSRVVSTTLPAAKCSS